MRKYRYWGMISVLGVGLALTLAGCGGGGGGGGHSSSVGSDSSYTSNAAVTTLAGTGSGTFVDNAGASATFTSPTGLALNAAKTYLYVVDKGNNAIRRIDLSDVGLGVDTLIGKYTSSDPITLKSPEGIVVDSSGVLYVTDTGNSRICQISANGGTGSAFVTGLSTPDGIAISGTNLYVAESGNHVIRLVDSGGTISTLAGILGKYGSTTDTSDGTSAKFYNPYGVAFDSSGNLYVTDCQNSTIRKITISGGTTVNGVTTLAGVSGTTGSTDGIGANALFNKPTGITYYSGYLYVADTGNHAIRKVNVSTGEVGTVAGYKGTNGAGSTNGIGNAAKFSSPTGLVSDGTGILYVADKGNNRIRKIVLP